MMGPPPKPSTSGFGGERRCDSVSEPCPSPGRSEGYTVRTDESEGAFEAHIYKEKEPPAPASLPGWQA